jgi:hypothetical protein
MSGAADDPAGRQGLGQGIAFGLWNLAWGGGQAIGSAGGAGIAEVSSDAVPTCCWRRYAR